MNVKLRRNHTPAANARSSMIRLVLVVLLLGAALAGSVLLFKKLPHEVVLDQPVMEDASGRVRSYIPDARGQVVHHTYYSLSYIEKHEQAEWVAYLLSRDQLRLPNVARTNYFNPDPLISTGSAVHGDYIQSGYTRGHLAPAGDMAFDKVAMEESFYMSNMSPQLRAFNNGVWRELEESVRDWAFSAGALYVVSGPVFYSPNPRQIGKNKVSVPDAFYKVVLIYDGKNSKAAGFIIPHALSEKPLSDYLVTVDEVERQTGIDFFYMLLDDEMEEKIESETNPEYWKFSEKRYRLRVSRWNKE